MASREIGKSGLSIESLALGGNVFGWTIDEPTSHRVLDAFIDLGLNAIDTADVYFKWARGNKGGESETVIGNWFKASGNRQRVILMTKVGGEMEPGKKGLSRQYIVEAVEASLARLQTDYIDIYFSHYDDADTPVEETLEAYAQLIKQGKVRAIGASNFSAARLRESLQASSKLDIPRYEVVQPPYNLVDRGKYEDELRDICLTENIGVVAYFGLASGFLTGKYRQDADFDQNKARKGMLNAYRNERGYRILSAVDAVASELGATPSQVSLAWLMAKPAVVPIASATSTAQLQELAKARDLTLSAGMMQRLDNAGLESASA